jgi:hypothetical protein
MGAGLVDNKCRNLLPNEVYAGFSNSTQNNLYYLIPRRKVSDMAETQNILAWTLVTECPIPNDVNELLVKGEVAVAAYKTFRDSAIFTNKRLIVRDAQGITGKKVEIYSLPYTSILMWSTENAGRLFDFNSEVELWTKVGHIKINLQKGVDIRKFDRLIANALLADE